jgi:hypothetical protein
MRNLSDKYYEALDARERVSAAIEAASRDDGLEIQRLRQTCPQYNYRQTDPLFSDTMESLTSICMAVRLDQMNQVARWLVARNEDPELAQEALQSLADLEAGLRDIFDSLGAPGDAAEKFMPPPPILSEVLTMTPEPDGGHDSHFQQLKSTLPVLEGR